MILVYIFSTGTGRWKGENTEYNGFWRIPFDEIEEIAKDYTLLFRKKYLLLSLGISVSHPTHQL